MSHNKLVVVDSEKSPKICSTNWKEDLVLKRNLQVLDRSEHTVINRITVDQKILIRRFQTKLGRSKMSYARAMGNMEMQKKLRSKTTFVLNTNIGNNDNQDETLSRLWASGRRAYEDRVSADKLPGRRDIGAFTCIEADTAVPPAPKKQSIPDRTLMAANLRPSTAVTIPNPHTQRRPGTSIEIRPKRRPQDDDQRAEEDHETDMESKEEVSGKKKQRPQTAAAGMMEDQSREFEVVPGVRRPSTAGAYIQTTVLSEVPKTARPSAAARSSRVPASTGGNNGIGSMFKSNAFEISLLDFQRFRIHSANYENRVKRYGDSIRPFKADSEHSIDYYTAKLHSGMRDANRKNFRMEAATEATPEDIKRATGDLTIKNLTVKSVDIQHGGDLAVY